MKINKLKLQNFRNYEQIEVEFGENVNCLVGRNAQGKTNLVEPIYIISALKSFRNSKLVDCIEDTKDFAKIIANISSVVGTKTIEYTINKDGTNEYLVNHNKITKKRDMYGHSYAVIFSPDELKLVKGSPDVRRDFLDTDICQISNVYSDLLDRYDKVLQSRNKLLKFSKSRDKLNAELDVWDISIATLGAQITKTRENFVANITRHAEKIMQHLSKNAETLTVSYIGINGETKDEKCENLLSALKFNRSKDIELGYTSIGPHRDEVKFFINGLEVKPFASQGQQRSVVLALKLAEMEAIKEVKEEPILILDDVFSELDSTRQKLLLEYLSGKQVFITCTNFRKNDLQNLTKFRIKNAKIVAEN